MTLSIEHLAHRHEGQRAIILGNGPSLNHTPLHLLADEQVWASNRAYLLFDRIDWRPSHYVAIDPFVIANSRSQLSTCVAELPETTFFFPEDVSELLKLESADNVCWFSFSHSAAQFADGRQRFEIARAATVTVVSMQLAALLGFSTFVLTGCDMNYQHTVASASAGVSGAKADRFAFKGGADADHFHPDYLDRDADWAIPEVAKMFLDFQQIARQFEASGIDVGNATVGGRLECFRRVDLATALAKGT
jgi:hypothetical protein